MTAYAVWNGYVGLEISGVKLDGKVVSIDQIRKAFNEGCDHHGTAHVCRSVRGYLFEMQYESGRWSGTMFSETINLPPADVRNVVPLYAEIPA